MRLARVIGQVVATVKDERQRGWKLLQVQPIDTAGRPLEAAVVAIDAAQAGVGDVVLLLAEGKSARQLMGSADAPCEAIVAGVIDHVECGGRRCLLAGSGTAEEA